MRFNSTCAITQWWTLDEISHFLSVLVCFNYFSTTLTHALLCLRATYDVVSHNPAKLLLECLHQVQNAERQFTLPRDLWVFVSKGRLSWPWLCGILSTKAKKGKILRHFRSLLTNPSIDYYETFFVYACL